MDYLTELFCKVDDFCQKFEPELQKHLIKENPKARARKPSISLSELMTITILFHQLRYRQFKMFYIFHLKGLMQREFPNMPSYNRCIELMPRCLLGLSAFLQTLQAPCTGVSIIDSTALAVCHNRRIDQHRVFDGYATRSKTSVDWFFGFKLHLIINYLGEIISFKLTTGNVDDRQPVEEMCRYVFGLLVGDKGYIKRHLTHRLKQRGIELLTPIKRKMKPVKRSSFEKYLLQRRSLVETVIDQLKNLCQIEHTRHRAITGFLVNLMGGMIAYSLSPNKPKLPLSRVKRLERAVN